MCQLCGLRAIAQRSRWPTPLEPLIADLEILIQTVHVEANTHTSLITALKKAQSIASSSTTPPLNIAPLETRVATTRAAVIATVNTILALIDLLDHERAKWWNDPVKKVQRGLWAVRGQTEKLTGVNKVNNAAREMVEAMRARVGTYLHWGLGVEGEVGGAE